MALYFCFYLLLLAYAYRDQQASEPDGKEQKDHDCRARCNLLVDACCDQLAASKRGEANLIKQGTKCDMAVINGVRNSTAGQVPRCDQWGEGVGDLSRQCREDQPTARYG